MDKLFHPPLYCACYYLLPPPWWRLCFHRCLLVCLSVCLSVRLSVCLSVRLSVRLSVCLSVCLSVRNIMKKRLNGFSWKCQSGWDLIQGKIGNIFRIFHLTPWTQNFFSIFLRNPCLLAALQKNGWPDVKVNPLNPGSIYLFSGSVTVCNIMEKQVNGFSWNFYKTSGTTPEIIS